MANEFYQPLQYPSFQYAQPYQPITGAIQAYTLGLDIRNRQLEQQRAQQQLDLQKQAGVRAEKQMAMEERREERAVEEYDRKKRWQELEDKDKMEIRDFTRNFYQSVMPRADLTPGLKGMMALQGAQRSGNPELVKFANSVIADEGKKIMDPSAKATYLNTVYGTNLTPQDIELEGADVKVDNNNNVVVVSRAGKILSQVMSEQEKYERGLKEREFAAAERHRRTMESRASSDGGAASEREVGNAEQAAKTIYSIEQRLNRREQYARELEAGGDVSGFADVAGEGEIARFLNASGEAKKARARAILENEVKPGRKTLDLQKKRYTSSFSPQVRNEAARRNPSILELDTWGGQSAMGSPYAADKGAAPNPLTPPQMPPKAQVQAAGATGQPMLGPDATPEQKEARRRELLAQQEAAQRGRPVSAAPIAAQARTALTILNERLQRL